MINIIDTRTNVRYNKNMSENITSKTKIIEQTRRLFARHGYDGFTMRSLAKQCDISLSSIYHHFDDKDVLLKAVFDDVNTYLGKTRSELPELDTASEELRQRIEFQFENAEYILFVLRYYLHFRDTFPKQERGYLSEKAYRHISEVLQRGVASGEFQLEQTIEEEAKVIAHSINGFVLEYFPESPAADEYKEVVDSIHRFVVRSLSKPAANAA